MGRTGCVYEVHICILFLPFCVITNNQWRAKARENGQETKKKRTGMNMVGFDIGGTKCAVCVGEEVKAQSG